MRLYSFKLFFDRRALIFARHLIVIETIYGLLKTCYDYYKSLFTFPLNDDFTYCMATIIAVSLYLNCFIKWSGFNPCATTNFLKMMESLAEYELVTSF